jgi:dihydrolipoamide dehydrogenase
LPGLEIDGEKIITSDHGTKMNYVPKSVIVLGGGVIGCEFASVWKSFGAEVTIIEGLPHLIALEDESSSKQLERAFRKRKINFVTGVRFASATKSAEGVTVTLEDGTTHSADVLLVAVGRGPVTSGIGYEEQGIAMDRGYITVDEKCRTNIPGIWAVGDIIPTLQLAHVGFQEGILVAETIAGLNPRPINYDGVPRVTYSEPEVASVGLSTKIYFKLTRVASDTVNDTYGADALAMSSLAMVPENTSGGRPRFLRLFMYVLDRGA